LADAIDIKDHASTGAGAPCVHAVSNAGGMVATAFPAASEAAVKVLAAGGNAIDAAVAAAWALAVCEPSGSGLGGQTTMLIRFADGRTTVIDGASCAPEGVSKATVSRTQQNKGYRACTIPSTPATLDHARSHYGSLSSAAVMEPAIRLAEEGYAVTRLQRRQAKWCMDDLLACPASARFFLSGGQPFHIGQTLRQKELAATLRRMVGAGVDDFYRGGIARDIAADMARHDGFITEKDLAECRFPVEHPVIAVPYRGYQVLSVPPPGGGLQVLLGLRVMERMAADASAMDLHEWYEMLASVTHAVFRQRDRYVMHPRDLDPSLLKSFLSDGRVEEVAQLIRSEEGRIEGASEDEGPGDTTHLCAVDKDGNAVALTQSIQSLFGAKVANGKLGFLYNNYLCTCKRRQHPYRLASRCIPQSNVAPTIVLKDASSGEGQHHGDPFLLLGAAGSRRITSSILQVISAMVDRGLSVQEAVSLPRIHGLLSSKVYVEEPAATEPLLKRLSERSQAVRVKSAHNYAMGSVQAIAFGTGGSLAGMADPRRDGVAIGL
jgi:gamma-glutamyltranspeptidase / glutathione hydrolase